MNWKLMCRRNLAAILLGAASALSPAQAQTTETIVDGTSFNSVTALESEWNYYYPWGSTHNGSAKMYPEQISLSGGVMTISAVTPDPYGSTYKYASGTIHMKDSICITEQHPEWSFYGEFQAPNVTGSWPAFWITHAGSWTHEVDILEFKGNTENWFNTYDGGWETTRVNVPDSMTAWHSYELVASKGSGNDVMTKFYLDGVLKGTHTLSGGMGKCFWLIINMQMEGSSGSPGPTSPTYYRARNLVVSRTVMPSPPGAPSVPSNLVATAGNAEVRLDWSDSPEWDTSYYSVYMSTSGGSYSLIGTVPNSKATVQNLTVGTSYSFKVTATDLDGNESAQSGVVSATPVTPPVDYAYWKFDESSGTTASDSWGSRHGSLVNGPTWVQGTVGNAINLDGSNDYVSLPTDLVHLLHDFTVATWVRLSSTPTWSRVFDFGAGTSVYMFLTPNSGDGVARYGITTTGSGSNEQRINSTGPLPVNQWVHVAVTLSGTVGTLYVNGAAVGQNNNMTLRPSDLGLTTQNYIGKSQYADPYLPGQVDDFRIHSRALSASEISALANPPAPNPPTNLAASSTRKKRIDLSWTQSSSGGITQNKIYRSTTSGGSYSLIGTISAGTSYANTGLSSGTTYYYVVTAVGSGGQESAVSNQASATAK